jgi:protein phosphatase
LPVGEGPVGEVPVAAPVAEFAGTVEQTTVPDARPIPMVETLPSAEAPELAETLRDAPADAPAPAVVSKTPTNVILEPSPPPQVILCPVCQSKQPSEQDSCSDCGYYFAPSDRPGGGNGAPANDPALPTRLRSRYELRERLGERQGVERFRGLDHGDGNGAPSAVFIVRQHTERQPETVSVAELAAGTEEPGEEIVPTFDDAILSGAHTTAILPARPGWPSVTWEWGLLRTLEQPVLPRAIDFFAEDGFDFLVLEIPSGRSFWDAWDDPDATNVQRFTWLVQLAEALASMHHCNAMLEAIRPELVVIDDAGHARLCDVSDLLPLPIPHGVAVRGTLYTAPELMSGTGTADARAGLYSFGAMLYALHVGRELQEIDFDRPGHPKPFIPRFPDVHPALGRLLTKTFRREPASRFPTDEAIKEDVTGFLELIRTLNVLRRTLDLVRMEVASWTTTGIVRTGNEDGYALLHACESRQDDLGEQVLIILADGMGGYEAGEVAAALAIQALRQHLVQQKTFAALSGKSPFATDPLAQARPDGHGPDPIDVEVCKQLIKAALKEANKQVFQASRAPGSKRRGMGCTAEVVFLDGRNVVVGHVGDSRTYHLHEGRLVQLTRDQTLVNRLVELGTLTAAEAEHHPRRNELQQAVGGQPDVEPGLYHGQLRPGDWVVVCSDGLTNHVSALSLKEMLLSEAQSAEMAARRLVNLTNIEGATDNATVIAVRCT